MSPEVYQIKIILFLIARNTSDPHKIEINLNFAFDATEKKSF